MTDTERLRDAIKKSGIKHSFICKKLNLSNQGFLNKIENKTEFKTSEIGILCDVLGITSLKEKEEIFFAKM